ncbi:MAG TPA: glycosyltransferase family 39 protein [Candidatus Baltobacteraceae bacterium]|nr:glycosyltransferase family 39 protein [Candidatus Baltobacteraceae bacterium]
MDVQRRRVDATPSSLWWGVGLVVVLAIAVALRLKGIHDPILDHPGWRQGDTASIARNFFRLQYNVMYPQTTYNGPPPNYVELELQIVPFMAATLYKIFGLHEVFGRLISIAFSAGTVVVIALFGRWLFTSSLAGLIAAFFFAVYPGSVYYGRAFMPDTAMVFFLTAALYAVTRFLLENERMEPRALARVGALLTFAYLAKPVAVAGFVPVLCAVWDRVRSGLHARVTALGVLLIVPLLILWLYDRRVASYAEWHWSSGIMRLHVLPALQSSFTGLPAFLEKFGEFRFALGMLRSTILGTAGFCLAIASFVALPWIAARSRTMLWGWLGAGLAYVFVVVTVERVDYYMLLLVPLCALMTGGALAAYVRSISATSLASAARYALIAIVPILGVVVLFQGVATAKPYYAYNKAAYRNAIALDRRLDRNALVVIGHYGPDVQYYIDRFGWEEDPALWTPFDEQSAIRKGSRYFISIEDNRLRRNAELCAWLQRFPVINSAAAWPVYVTDPAKMLPHADAFWRAFRAADRAGRGRAFLDAHGTCKIASAIAR